MVHALVTAPRPARMARAPSRDRTAPRLRVVASRPMPGLPQPVALLGRAEAQASLIAALDAAVGPVTVVGPPGVGKSALALAVAQAASSAEGTAAMYVDLSEAVTQDDVWLAFARALGVASEPDQVTEGTLQAALRRADAGFVVIDGADRAAAALADPLAALSCEPSSVRWLITARSPIGITGERVVRLGPLAADAASALFRARATAAGAGSLVAPMDAIETLVEALDRLPLAIELAAARASVLTVREMLDHLGARARLTGAGPAGGGMDAALAWSWDSLPDDARHLLVCASVFQHPFTLDAARAVVGEPAGADGLWIVDGLAMLHERSLLRVLREPDAPTTRYGVYATLRDFALQRAAPDALTAARNRHAAWFAAQAADLAGSIATRDEPSAVAGFDAVRGDVLAALEHIVTSGRPGAARALLDVEPLLGLCLRHDAHMGWIERALALEDARDPAVELQFRSRRAIEQLLRGRRGDPHGDVARFTALDLAEVPEDLAHRVEHVRALAAFGEGRLEAARDHVARARAITRSEGLVRADAGLSILTGMIEGALGDRGGDARDAHYAASRRAYDEALAVYEPQGHVRACAAIYGNIGNLHMRADERPEQRFRFEQSLEAARRVANAFLECVSLANLAWADIVDREVDRARALLAEASDVAEAAGRPIVQALSDLRLGVLEADIGRADAARERWLAARGTAQRAGVLGMVAEIDAWLALLAWGQGRDGEARSRLGDVMAGADAGRALVAAHLASLIRGDETPREPLTSATAPHLARPEALQALLDHAHAARDGAPGALIRAVVVDADGRVTTALQPIARVFGRCALDRLTTRDRSGAPDESVPLPATSVDRSGPAIVLFGDARAVQIGDADGVDLSRRRVVRRIARHLVDALDQHPGDVQSVDALLEVGWPGERFVRDSATNRLYAVMTTLRQLGFADLLQTIGGGYRLDPAWRVERRPWESWNPPS